MTGGGALAVLLVALAVSRSSVFAAQYNVIGDGGCSDFWTSECLYNSWASYELLVGDILVFTFDPTSSTVAIVSESQYNTCENGISAASLKQIGYDSPSMLELQSPGELHVVSVMDRTCHQKLHITVKSSSNSATRTKAVKGVVGVLVSYALLLGTVSFVVYFVVHGRKQRQLLAQLQAQPNLQDETSPALFADGQYDVEVNEQGEYVANDQPPAAATSRSVGVGYNHRPAAADAAVYNTNLRLQDIQRSVNQLGRLG